MEIKNIAMNEKEHWLMDNFALFIEQNEKRHKDIIGSCGFHNSDDERNYDKKIRRYQYNSMICDGHVVSFHVTSTYDDEFKSHFIISDKLGDDETHSFDDEIDAAEYLCGDMKHDEMLYRSYRTKLIHLKNQVQ